MVDVYGCGTFHIARWRLEPKFCTDPSEVTVSSRWCSWLTDPPSYFFSRLSNASSPAVYDPCGFSWAILIAVVKCTVWSFSRFPSFHCRWLVLIVFFFQIPCAGLTSCAQQLLTLSVQNSSIRVCKLVCPYSGSPCSVTSFWVSVYFALGFIISDTALNSKRRCRFGKILNAHCSNSDLSHKTGKVRRKQKLIRMLL